MSWLNKSHVMSRKNINKGMFVHEGSDFQSENKNVYTNLNITIFVYSNAS